MTLLRALLGCVCWFVVVCAIPGGVRAQTLVHPFSVQSEPRELSVAPGGRAQVSAVVRVPKDHFLYEEFTQIDLQNSAGLQVVSIEYPDAVVKFDPFLQKEVPIYDRDALITIELLAPEDLAPGTRVIKAVVAYQGCSPKLCFRRTQDVVEWAVNIEPGGAAVAAAGPTNGDLSQETKPKTGEISWADPTSWFQWLTTSDIRQVLQEGGLLAFILTFIGGILTSFTPCVLPLIPVVLLIIGVHAGDRRHNLWLATCLTLGVAVTYALVGLVASLVGLPIAFLFQQRWFLIIVVAVFALMALSMFGLFSLRLPSALQNRLQKVGGKGPKGAFLAGMSTGVLATPCAGPVVAALITFVGVNPNVGLGFSLLFTYGLGFGFVFIIVGTFYGELSRRLPKGGTSRFAKVVLGIMLLIPAGYYTWVLASPSPWEGSEAVAFAEAQRTGRPVMIEFTAKSCPPCLVMEQTTFQDPEVIAAFKDRVVPLRIDMTFPSDELLATANRYKVIGWPALLFAAPSGDVFWDLSLIGEIVKPKRLLEHIGKAEERLRVPHLHETTRGDQL